MKVRYKPQSWSQQAREMSDMIIQQVNSGWRTIADAHKFFQNSYRHPLIRGRAAKRFGRKLREGKVHENLEVYYQHFPDECDATESNA